METVSYSTEEKIQLLRANGYVIRKGRVSTSPYKKSLALQAGRKYDIDTAFEATVKSILLMMNPGGEGGEEEEGQGFYTEGAGIDITGPVISLEHLGIENLTAPGEDKILFYDYSEGAVKWADLGEASYKFKISANDDVAGYLEDKLALSYGGNASEIIELSTINEGANEKRILQIDETKISHDNIADVSANDHHNQAHALATTGPHTDSLPLTDLAPGTAGDIITRQVSDWAVLTKGTQNHVLKMGATYPEWGTVDWSELTGTQPSPISHTHGNITNAGAIGSTANLPIITTTAGVLIASSFGTSGNTFCEGDDSRLSDDRDPNAHVLVSADHTASGLTSGHFLKATGTTSFGFAAHGLGYGDVGAEEAFSKNTAFNKDFGTTGSEVTVGNDSRLSNARTPTQHAMDSATYHSSSNVTTLNATTGKHGFLRKLGGGTTNYLRADGNWATPPGSGMVYPGAGIALSTGSAWGTSITNNSGNWNTAYGWGDHDGLYLTLSSIGTDNQIPYVNSGGNGFDYSANLTFDGTDLTIGAGDLLIVNTGNTTGSGLVVKNVDTGISAGITSVIQSYNNSLTLSSYGANHATFPLENHIHTSYAGAKINIGSFTEYGILFIEGDAVKLYFHNAQKFETLTGGAKVTGDLTISGIAGNNRLTTVDANGKLISEANLTFDGTKLNVYGEIFVKGVSTSGVLEEQVRFGRADATIRYHSIYSIHNSGAENNRMDFLLHDGGGSPFLNQITVMSLRGDGNVGINETNPSYKLDVNGTGRFTGDVIIPTISGDVDITGKLTVDPASGVGILIDRVAGQPSMKADVGYMIIDSDGDVLGLNWYVTDDVVACQGGGKFGINKITPLYKLDVVTDHVSGYAAYFFNDGNNVNRYGIGIQCGVDTTVLTDNEPVRFLKGNGNYFASIFYNQNEIDFGVISDIRLKENIEDYNINGLDIINQMQYRSFNWKKDKDKLEVHGWIADEVEEIYPKMVSMDAETGLKRIAKTRLIPVLVSAVQELDGKFQQHYEITETHEDKIISLQKRVKDLEDEVQLLKN